MVPVAQIGLGKVSCQIYSCSQSAFAPLVSTLLPPCSSINRDVLDHAPVVGHVRISAKSKLDAATFRGERSGNRYLFPGTLHRGVVDLVLI